MSHQIDHTHINHCFAAFRQILIIFAETTVAAQPTKGSFDDPSVGQNLEAPNLRAFDNVQSPATDPFGPSNELSGISAIRPDQCQTAKAPLEPTQNISRSVAVLNAGGMNDHGQQQSQCIHNHVTLAPAYFLARIIAAARPPFSVVFTLWLSMIAALGDVSRPSFLRTWARRQS
jgi:hypothetical protein